jgi:hypothetical protein
MRIVKPSAAEQIRGGFLFAGKQPLKTAIKVDIYV